MTNININIDKLMNTAEQGVRRASVFMGFGINAAYDPEFSRYDLTSITKIQLVPSNVSEDTLADFKKEFGYWVVANGLRELIETFAVFLEQVCQACLVIAANRNLIALKEAEKLARGFPKMGFPMKLSSLQEQFGVCPKKSACLLSINKARNCLTHRRGVVASPDCNDANGLRMCWRGLDLFAVPPSGEEISLDEFPVYLPQGGQVKYRWIERCQVFSQSSRIILTPKDLAEICWFISLEAKETCSSLVSFAERAGIPDSRGGVLC